MAGGNFTKADSDNDGNAEWEWGSKHLPTAVMMIDYGLKQLATLVIECCIPIIDGNVVTLWY